MRGIKTLTTKIFYQFSLENEISQDHILRKLHNLLDWTWVRQQTADLYGYNGNVSVDPVVIVKILLLGYLYNIHSTRELMRQIKDRLTFRWFIRYDLDEKIPDHSVISKARRRFGPALFQQFFDQTVQLCCEAGLVDGNLVHADSTTVKANASLKSVRNRHSEESFHPDLAPQAYWDALEAEDPQPVNQGKVSSTDPDAGIISRPGGKLLTLCYSDHRVLDDQRGVILVTQATPGHVTDNLQLPSLLDGLIFHQGIVPQALAADRKYGALEIYKELQDKGITAHIPRQKPGSRKGKFSKEVFTYSAQEDRYICPAGERLKPPSSSKAKIRRYRAPKKTCQSCSLRSQCVDGESSRSVARYQHEEYYERTVQERDLTAYAQARKRRMVVAEGSFANAKGWHAHRNARWRSLDGMQIQCYLVAAAQNLKKLVKYSCKPIQTAVKTAATIGIRLFHRTIYINFTPEPQIRLIGLNKPCFT